MTRHIRVGVLVGVLCLTGYSPWMTRVRAEGFDKEITVVLRYDDPSGKTPVEEITRLAEALRRHEMCCTVGVIPFACAGDSHDPKEQSFHPLTEPIAEALAESAREGLFEIGLHGYSHQTNSRHTEGWFSEFKGLAYEEQLEKIAEGKNVLERMLGLSVTTFIPPWNSYDANTVRALEAAEFRCLSANPIGTADAASSLLFAPATTSLGQLKDAVKEAREAPGSAPVVMALLHNYDFREVDAARGTMTYEQFSQTLQWLSRQNDVKVVRVGDLADATPRRYLDNRRLLRMRKLFPRFLPVESYWSVHLSEEAALHVRRSMWLGLAVIYGAEVLLAAGVSFILAQFVSARGYRWAMKGILLLGPVLLLGGLVWTCQDGDFGAKAILAVAGILGYCGGTWAVVPYRLGFPLRRGLKRH